MTDGPSLQEQLADQLHRAMMGGAWHGPAVREALEGMSAPQAASHPIAGTHSIWELVLHLRGTYQLVLRRIDGSDAPFLPAEDWPPLPEPTEENWRRDVASLLGLNARLMDAVREFPVERLFQPLIPDPPYSAFTQFIGVTQHNLYHAGQIVLLKRLSAS